VGTHRSSSVKEQFISNDGEGMCSAVPQVWPPQPWAKVVEMFADILRSAGEGARRAPDGKRPIIARSDLGYGDIALRLTDESGAAGSSRGPD